MPSGEADVIETSVKLDLCDRPAPEAVLDARLPVRPWHHAHSGDNIFRVQKIVSITLFTGSANGTFESLTLRCL